MPVRSVIAAQRSRSLSSPSQLAEVPFQQMTWTLASASSEAASSIGSYSNWPSAASLSEISVTRKRPKWTDTSGRPATMALETGSKIVFEDGVSMPRRVRWVMS